MCIFQHSSSSFSFPALGGHVSGQEGEVQLHPENVLDCEVGGRGAGGGQQGGRSPSMEGEVLVLRGELMADGGWGIETPAHNNAGDDIKTYTITAFPRHRETTSRKLQYSLLPPSANYFQDSCLMGGALEAAEYTFSSVCITSLRKRARETGISSC